MNILKRFLLLFAIAGSALTSYSQGVTTGSLSGVVTDAAGLTLPGATILAVHEPSGTRYGTATFADGRFNIVGMRVGGPYTITVSFIGFETVAERNITILLGGTVDLRFALRDAAAVLGEVVITGIRDNVLSSGRTGASSTIDREAIASLPAFTRRISDFTRLTPQASRGNSFAGQDGRFNNITVDGSFFNNSFGLGGQPGDRTGVAPISMDAIEQITVNIAPYDVRQGSFSGAGINTVTRSGTNQFEGSVFYNLRDENFVGTQAGANEFDPGNFNFRDMGITLGGPIVRDRLFFFASVESEQTIDPGTTFRANMGGEPIEGNVTRVLASDLDSLSSFLRRNFGYETGPYQGYDHETPATRLLFKLDWNINDRNNLSLRYNHLDSRSDILLSNSSSLGRGTRRTNLIGLNFQNSNYIILENIRSIVGELNSRIGANMANNLIIGYTFHDESRDSRGSMFPMVDILDGGSVYTTFGFEPFTPNNELRYQSLQFQNNLTVFANNHTLTFGVSAEMYESENIFFDGSQSIYVYNSLSDFYTDALDFIANPARITSPVTLNRFQLRHSAQPGVDIPVQPLEVFSAGVYGQNQWRVSDQLTLTFGLRMDVPIFGDTGFTNPDVPGMNFIDEHGDTVSFATENLPDPRIHWSPRFGFNWDVTGDRAVQLRGGTGIFTGRPPFVWISNQIGNNGMLTGFIDSRNTRNFPFNPDTEHYKPEITEARPAPSYALALTDPNFMFPQSWRSNFALDVRLPFDFVATLEGIFSRDVNGVYYINANLSPTDTAFVGADNRPRWLGGDPARRINDNVTSAIVLKNQNVGYSYNLTASLQRQFRNGLFTKIAYNYGVSRNTVDPGSVAIGSWTGNPHSGDPNNPGLTYSVNNPGHRFIAALSYRKEYFNIGATQIGLFLESANAGTASYVFEGDLNNDGATANDLIYIPRDASEMNFVQYSITSPEARTFTVADQQAAWEAFIQQDPYLSANRGQYATRNGILLPMRTRIDLSLIQDIFTTVGGTRNTLQFRVDVINLANLLNSDWGVGQALVHSQPLIARGADAQGRARYEMRNIGGQLMSSTFRDTAGLGDVFRLQFGIRYKFN